MIAGTQHFIDDMNGCEKEKKKIFSANLSEEIASDIFSKVTSYISEGTENPNFLMKTGPNPLILRVLVKCSTFFRDCAGQLEFIQYNKSFDHSSLELQLGQFVGGSILCI